MGLAQRCDWGRLEGLTAYHVTEDGSTHEVLPKEWDGVASELAALSKRLKKDDPDAAVSYPEWREQSISCLPSHCFVWLDEFERVYKRAMDWLHIVNERAGDKQLNYYPRIPAAAITAVFEGLPRMSSPPTTEASTKSTMIEPRHSDITPLCSAAKNELSNVNAEASPGNPSDPIAVMEACIKSLPYQPKMLLALPAAWRIVLQEDRLPSQLGLIAMLMQTLGVSRHEAKLLDMQLRPDQIRFRNYKGKGKGKKASNGAAYS